MDFKQKGRKFLHDAQCKIRQFRITAGNIKVYQDQRYVMQASIQKVRRNNFPKIPSHLNPSNHLSKQTDLYPYGDPDNNN